MSLRTNVQSKTIENKTKSTMVRNRFSHAVHKEILMIWILNLDVNKRDKVVFWQIQLDLSYV